MLSYLRFFARLQVARLRRLNPQLKIVGITGSVGKTSCLLASEAALKPHFKLLTNYGGNSESGVPLSLLGLKMEQFSLFNWIKVAILVPFKYLTTTHSPDIILLELGIDSPTSPKNMSYLLSIVQPDIGIFLNVTSVHVQNFSSIDHIAQEKSKLVNSTTISIINSSDPLVVHYSPPSSIIIKPQKINIKGFVFPSDYDLTFGAAIALANIFKIDQKIAINNIKTNFHPAPGRNLLLAGINNSILIDSTYNSSYLATTQMLELLSHYPSPRIAILGDMRELGDKSSEEHQNLYQVATRSADTIISVGPDTSNFFGEQSIKFTYWWQALEYLQNNSSILNHATVLIKGSQNTIFLEELVKGLLANPADVTKLCRQSPYWLQVKQNFRSQH